MKFLAIILTAAVYVCISPFSASAAFEQGGAALVPAIDAFSTLTQFSSPDTQTPAIDETGCLDYSLAKIAVRYNLPLEDADVFDSSYDYYTEFVENAVHPAYTKAIYFSEYFAPYVRFIEHIPITADSAGESWQEAYAYCRQMQQDIQAAFVLELSTSSGSSHFVSVDTVNETEKRLYLYDSGDRFSEYLGDSVSESRGYHVESIYTIELLAMPGDVDGDFQITWTDSFFLGLMCGFGIEDLSVCDANHDGVLDEADITYIEAFARHMQVQSPELKSSIK